MSSVNADTDVDEAWEAYVKQRRQDDLNEIIASEKLKADETAKSWRMLFVMERYAQQAQILTRYSQQCPASMVATGRRKRRP